MGRANRVESVRARLVRASGHVLTDYQQAFLADGSPMRAVLKARQTGFSWLFALEALSEGIARGAFSIFVSLNREEAAEKLSYARELLEGLPLRGRPRLLRSATHEMRLEGGGRLLSFPCRAPRGKARASVYLDELAFYPNSEAVYSGALPVVSHGGRVVVASTPYGERGMFWRAVRDTAIEGQFSRHEVPWWRAPWFRAAAPPACIEEMDTEERVARFGAPVLQRQLSAMDLQSFQQEYELHFMDADEAFLPWEEIRACLADVRLADTWPALRPYAPRLYAGMDIGRMHDATEIIVLASEEDRLIVRAMRTLRSCPYEDQEREAAAALSVGGVSRLCLDSTGIGEAMAERLHGRFRGQVMPLRFTVHSKEVLATDLRWLMQRGKLVLPNRRDLMEQLHSVRRATTQASRVRFDAPRAAHHADQFWALAMAVYAARYSEPGIRARVV